ncbi:hypothetical protein ACS0TY_021452 [Phlomoides rotata]
MSYIPPELHRNILVQLPAESLFRFRCVCKVWLGIIDDPSFIRAHTNNQLYSHTLLLGNRLGSTLYSFSLDSLNYIKGHQMIDPTCIKRLIEPSLPVYLQDLFKLASCNGLILMPQMGIKPMWRIWNPLTGDSHKFRQLYILEHNGVGFGLGYDGDADDYKVVRIHKYLVHQTINISFVYQTFVYSLKSNSWSMIQDCPCFPCDSRGTFWNGALYWPSNAGVIALHLGTNSYCMLPLPPAANFVECFHITLDALGGYLICSLRNCTRGTFDGWVMKDNGVEKSWIKLISLQFPPDGMSLRLRLVAYLSSKEQVLVQMDSHFLWFDIGNNSVLKFSIHGIPNIISSIICPFVQGASFGSMFVVVLVDLELLKLE